MKGQFDKVKFLLSEKLTLYPILTGILFLINELRNNAAFYTVKENVFLILIVLVFTVLVDFLSHRLIKNKIKAALIAVLFVLINLFYQDIFLIISGQKLLMNFINSTTSSHPDVIIIPVLFIAWLAFTFSILRIKWFLTSLNLYLNVLLIAFILLEITQWFIAPVPRIKLVDNESFPVNADLLQEQKPDIYYIILDAYTSSESLKRYWKYNNSEFEDSLKKVGFYIPHDSKTDFTSTPYCLAAYFNSSSLILDSTKHYNDRNLLPLIRNNRLFDWLRANDYLCFNYSVFDTFGNKKYYNFSNYNDFLGRTIWVTFLNKLYHYLIPSSRISQTNLKIFKKLNELSEKSQHKSFFAYAHLMTPHSPYSFDKKGRPVNDSDSLTDKQKYLDQLIFTNYLTLKTVNHILFSSRNKPIIVIQGDHGYRNLSDTTLFESSYEAHTVFYAIYTPIGLLVSDTSNPINTFKILIKKINH